MAVSVTMAVTMAMSLAMTMTLSVSVTMTVSMTVAIAVTLAVAVTVAMSMSVAVSMAMAMRDCCEVVKLAGFWWHTVAVKLFVAVTLELLLLELEQSASVKGHNRRVIGAHGGHEKKSVGYLTVASWPEMCLGHWEVISHSSLVAGGAGKLDVRIESSLPV